MGKVLVYDGDCRFCASLARGFGSADLPHGGERLPYGGFDPEMTAWLDEHGIRDEMLVFDGETREVRVGIDGFLWALEGSPYAGLGRLLGIPPLRWLLRHGYRAIAYNRRLIAPPPRGMICACDPDPHPGYRLLFFLLLAIPVAAVIALVSWIT
jgi:predicted DCC family thiol-disulfide oxidoreductase YuxK